MRSLRMLHLVSLSVIALPILPAKAQTASPQNSGQPSWQRVQALPLQTTVQVRTDTQKVTCQITAVTDDKLTCLQAAFSRSEIKSIKLTNKKKSTVSGLLLGAGVGAAAGAGIGVAINAGDTGSLIHESNGAKAAGVGAGLGAIIGIGVGAIFGHSTTLFASTIYKR
jgi:hypothetical protein